MSLVDTSNQQLVASHSAGQQQHYDDHNNGPAADAEMTIRALLNSKGAGIIIGKAGKTVEELREKTGVKAGVSKVIEGVNDRVLTVTGTVDKISEAFGFIVQLLIDTPPSSQPPADPTVTMARLLIPNSLMGSIIGRAGSKIKQIQDDHHVKLVAQKEPLPASTERVVDITGTAQGIEGAVREIAEALSYDWERGLQGTRFYDPKVRSAAYQATNGHASLGGGAYSGADGSSNTTSRSAYSLGSASMAARTPRLGTGYNQDQRQYDADNSNRYRRTGRGDDFTGRNSGATSGGGGNDYVARSDDPNAKTQTIAIPSDMVGCIIGKGGSRIGEIRTASGCRISISKVPNEQGERLFTIVGGQEANERALKMLYEQLEAERERRSAGGMNGSDEDLVE